MAANCIYPQAYPSKLEKFRQCYDRQPYTYYIGWFDINMWYYGVRFNKQAGLIPENDLWINYFTSCEDVQWYREQYGEPDYVAIHKTFNTIFEAQEYETNTLEEFKASIYWDHFINKSTNKSIDPMIGSDHHLYGKNHSNKTKNKIGQSNKGKKHSQKSKEKMSKTRANKPQVNKRKGYYLLDKKFNIIKEFNTGKELAEFFNMNFSTLRADYFNKQINGKKSKKMYKWNGYFIYTKSYFNQNS